ncbi:MAG: dTDP-4-dehydrorhamnose 3,5-epimerase [Planctomycetota bacterium]|nr:MAG: dTDP-4-dehydrorhamnose 3,5-epimerase [Planctomycetota bacterium]
MPFEFQPLEIEDVVLVIPKIFIDERGVFLETFKASDFQKAGIPTHFVQDSQSLSKINVVRGLHYQLPPMAQGKLVRALRGSLFDVAVDIRKGSPTYGQWVSAFLTEENQHMLWIPPGFAHGVAALEDNSILLYKVTAEYAPHLDRGIFWNDPELGISWPVKNPILSEKDQNLPYFRDCENTFLYTS